MSSSLVPSLSVRKRAAYMPVLPALAMGMYGWAVARSKGRPPTCLRIVALIAGLESCSSAISG